MMEYLNRLFCSKISIVMFEFVFKFSKDYMLILILFILYIQLKKLKIEI